MMLVDASVWIDFFKQAHTPQCRQLAQCLEDANVTVGTGRPGDVRGAQGLSPRQCLPRG
jgi:hypothetical protein